MMSNSVALGRGLILKPFPPNALTIPLDQINSYREIFDDPDIIARLALPRCDTATKIRKQIQRTYNRDVKLCGKSRTWFVLLNGRPIGLFYYHHPDKQKTMAFIAYGIVASQRRNGYGTIVLDLGLQELKKQGYQIAKAGVAKHNSASFSLLKKAGFQVIEDTPKYYMLQKRLIEK